jgi:hypothetical protein
LSAFHIYERVRVKRPGSFGTVGQRGMASFSLLPATVLNCDETYVDIRTDSGFFGKFIIGNVERLCGRY